MAEIWQSMNRKGTSYDIAPMEERCFSRLKDELINHLTIVPVRKHGVTSLNTLKYSTIGSECFRP